ncbi:MAG TPA: GPW/gp25 family protein [Sorangium sp.]|nr:GPW/gp25 family protein [Sorangium sp.]
MSRADRLGKGLGFPVRPDGGGGLPYAAGPEKVRESIRLILETEPGERIMRPTFGCGLRRYLMRPNTVATRALIQRDVERALRTWEPRVQVTQVAVNPGDDPALVVIAIAYVHARDGRPGSLVYPFYLE